MVFHTFAMFGEENSTTSFLPAPEVFVPYEGLPEGWRCVSELIWLSTSRLRVLSLKLNCTNAPNVTALERYSSG
jgi:hypothetical protein